MLGVLAGVGAIAEQLGQIRWKYSDLGRGILQGLKPTFIFGSVMARLKSRPYAV
jgi:hypothetical protein